MLTTTVFPLVNSARSEGTLYDLKDLAYAPLFAGEKREDHEFKGKKYTITSSNDEISRAAKDIFTKGGNVIDATTAMLFASAVVRPQSTGVGGGGFLLYFDPKTMKKPVAIDFREVAPLAAKEDMFMKDGKVVDGLSLEGIKSVAVPGFVAGVLEAHRRYGKLSRSVVLAPAIRLAAEGFTVYPHLAKAIDERKDFMAKDAYTKSLFFKGDKPLVKGDLLVQKDLAKTLTEIAAKGKDGFYKGWVAQAILKRSHELEGILSQKDLDSYAVKTREPVLGAFRGYEIWSMPPPSSGGTHVIEILKSSRD